MLRKLYLSPFGWFISAIQNFWSLLFKPFMVYGYYNRACGKFRKLTRISSSAIIVSKSKLDLADNIFIWHYSILDASNGIKIDEGCQIGAWVGIFSHGSHISIRLLGKKYIEIPKENRIGYQKGPVNIGKYTFIGASAIILPGVTIGKGCIIGASSVVSINVPDYSVVTGNPAKIVGSTLSLDKRHFKKELVREYYFDPEVINDYVEKNKSRLGIE